MSKLYGSVHAERRMYGKFSANGFMLSFAQFVAYYIETHRLKLFVWRRALIRYPAMGKYKNVGKELF